LPEIDYLRASRITHRWRAAPAGDVDIFCDLRQLPFDSNSIDLVILPHLLEFHPNPHQMLREVERVLIPEGRVVIIGFNPFSLWGLRRRLPRCPQVYPWNGDYLSVPRVKDWLALLGLEPNRGHFGAYIPPCTQSKWIRRWHWMEPAGDRWWPVAGGLYLLAAIKRVHGMRLIKPVRQGFRTAAPRLAQVAQRMKPPTATTKSQ
jgi:SAM-dependent methyltransferase